MFKQALRRILNFLDHNNNHKIRLEDFIDIMDEHNVELDPEEDPEYVQVMFSVPYNLNSYDSYLAVGVSPVYLNSSDGGVFKTFYYYSGSFQRAKAGRMAEYQSHKGKRVCRSLFRYEAWSS